MNRILALLVISFIFININAQKHTISGYVYDEAGESLVGANVIIKELSVGVVTNDYGFFSLTVKEGNYTLVISYLGYVDQLKSIKLSKDQKIVFNLEESTEMIESIKIVAERRDVNIREVSMSSEKLDIKTIEKIPSLFGEVDVIKVIQLQPGVATVGEGTSGFYVRGGAVDQNLILLDEAIVYNPAHFGGFFSVFNSDAVKSVELFKGGIPALYGGRQASVLDVKMKEGNYDHLAVTGGIGAISSRLTIEAPIVKDKASFLVSGRRTYYDLFFPLFDKPELEDSKVYFYDLNGKVNYRINDNNRIYLSLYSGKDVMGFSDLFQVQYGNRTGTLRWNHVFNDRLFSNFMLIGSQFDYSLGQPTGGFAFDWTSKILDYSFKNDYTYFLNPNNTVKFGLQIINHELSPGKFEPLGESTFNGFDITKENSYESAIYISNEQQASKRLSFQYGLRFSMFNNIGGVENTYSNDSVINVVIHEKGPVYNTYSGFEPRLGARYILDKNSSVKLSYNRTMQYLHLATNTQAPTPFDIWFSSNTNIKPQYTDQVAIGYFRNFFDNMLETSVEGYYKILGDAIDFKDHASIFGTPFLDGEMLQGQAYSYGAEFYLRKKYGKLTGWLSYTYSKTRRKIDGLNNDNEYPTNYDRPHDVKIVTAYDITPRLNIAVNWTYYSALPYTVAVSYSRIANSYYPKFSERNAYRFEGTDYHRLDFAATFNFYKPGAINRFKSSLTLSVYNVYNRHNLYSIIYNEDSSKESGIRLDKMYLFPVIPTFTYNFKF